MDTLELGGVFPWSDRFMCVLSLLPVWYYGMELILLSFVLLMLSAYSMARGQEDISTNQARRKRWPGRDTPAASSIISSMSMEELKFYCQIPDNIGFELLDGPVESIIDAKNGAVYFIREQLTAGLRFPILSLDKHSYTSLEHRLLLSIQMSLGS